MRKKGGKVSIGYLGEEAVVVISVAGGQTTIGHFASVETTGETVLSADQKAATEEEAAVEETEATAEEAAVEETAPEEATAEEEEAAVEEVVTGVALASNAEQIPKLQEQIAQLQEQIAQLPAQIAQLPAQIAQLREEIAPATPSEDVDEEAPSA
jgi:predicted RNase H-like nuclease (RuvC/YqgF family)